MNTLNKSHPNFLRVVEREPIGKKFSQRNGFHQVATCSVEFVRSTASMASHPNVTVVFEIGSGFPGGGYASDAQTTVLSVQRVRIVQVVLVEAPVPDDALVGALPHQALTACGCPGQGAIGHGDGRDVAADP